MAQVKQPVVLLSRGMTLPSTPLFSPCMQFVVVNQVSCCLVEQLCRPVAPFLSKFHGELNPIKWVLRHSKHYRRAYFKLRQITTNPAVISGQWT